MKASSGKLSVVIVAHNSSDVIRGCMSSLVGQDFDMTSCEILVVDNHSTDETIRVLQEEYPEFKLIPSGLNQGFAGAANRGAREGLGEFLLFLNPDTIREKSILRTACGLLDADPAVGIVGSRLVSPNGNEQPSCWEAPSWKNLLAEAFLPHHLAERMVTLCPNKSMSVPAVSGACLFTRRDVFERVGGWDERFFMYYEDLDYCRRVRTTGQKIYFNPEITIIHEHGSSSQQSSQSYHYLVQSSIWYNGPLKHYLMTTISWVSQKIHKLFP